MFSRSCLVGGAVVRWQSSASASAFWRRSLATVTNNSDSSNKVSSPSQFQSPSSPPWLMLSSPKNPEFRYFFDIIRDAKGNSKTKLNRKIHLPQIAGHHCIGSSQGFLVTIDIDRSNTDLHVTNPLTGSHHIIPCDRYNPWPSPRYTFSNCSFEAQKTWISPPQTVLLDTVYELLYQSKAIISPSLDTIILLRKGQPPTMTRVRVGSGWFEQQWLDCSPLAFPLADSIFHKGSLLLHSISMGGSFSILDFQLVANRIFLRPWTLPPPKGLFLSIRAQFPRNKPCYLVESPDGNDLFLVLRVMYPEHDYDPSPPRTKDFEVFKIEVEFDEQEEKQVYKLNEVHSIGDIAMFIGSNQSVSFHAHDFPNKLIPNSIYFTDRPVKRNLLKLNCIGDAGVYNLEEEGTADSIHNFRLRYHNQDLNWPMPIWYTPMC